MPHHGDSAQDEPDYLAEERHYRWAEREGVDFARSHDGPGLEVDFARIFSWDAFPRAGARLLELGCGDGYTTRHLVERGLVVDGVDCSPTAIARGRRLLESLGLDARLTVGDVCSLPEFPAGNYDAILDSHCLHCVVDPSDRSRFLGECRRLLSRDGVLFIVTMGATEMSWTTEGGSDDVRYHVDAQGSWVQSLRFDDTTRRVDTRIWVTEERLREELASAGLHIERFESFAPDDDPTDISLIGACRPA